MLVDSNNLPFLVSMETQHSPEHVSMVSEGITVGCLEIDNDNFAAIVLSCSPDAMASVIFLDEENLDTVIQMLTDARDALAAHKLTILQ